jgi:hypothetical protein
MFPRERRFDPSLHVAIGSILTGFAALILSLHEANCTPPAIRLPPAVEQPLPQLP